MKATSTPCLRHGCRWGLFPWTERAAYVGWLAQTYYYVRHSTRLLAAAAARFPHGGRATPCIFASARTSAKRSGTSSCACVTSGARRQLDARRAGGDAYVLRAAYYKVEHRSRARCWVTSCRSR